MAKKKENKPKMQNKPSYLPQGWQEIPLWEVCENPVSGYSPMGTDRPAGYNEVGVLKLNCIQGNRFCPEKNKAVEGTKTNELKTPVRKNTLIVSRSNTEELVGAVCYVDNDFPNLFLSDLLWRVSARDDDRIDLKWLSYLLSFAPYRAKIAARSNGTSQTMKKINKAGFLGIRIFCPKLNEQKKIAKVLSMWDIAIDQTRKLIFAKKNRKKALFQQLFGPREQWTECHLKDVANINSRSLPESTDPNFQFVYIDIASVNDGKVQENRKLIQFSKAPSRARRLFSEGDIIMSTVRPNLKNYVYVDFSCSQYVCSTGFAVITPKKNIFGPFLYQLLYSDNIQRQCYACIAGSNYPAMSQRDVERIKLCMPSIREQKKIAGVLCSADKEIESLKNKNNSLEKQKRGLMQKLLTGEIRVKT